MKNYKRSVFEDAAKVSHLTLQIGESDLLRKKSQSVKIKDIKSGKIKAVILKLKKTLSEFKRLTGKGKGIAAVQIGVPLKITVVFIDNKPVTLINPTIIKKSKESFYYPEICMSANPIVANVSRPFWVEVKYFDEEGNIRHWQGRMLTKKDFTINRVLQHEMDHFEGIINIDLIRSSTLILDSGPEIFNEAWVKILGSPNNS